MVNSLSQFTGNTSCRLHLMSFVMDVSPHCRRFPNWGKPAVLGPGGKYCFFSSLLDIGALRGPPWSAMSDRDWSMELVFFPNTAGGIPANQSGAFLQSSAWRESGSVWEYWVCMWIYCSVYWGALMHVYCCVWLMDVGQAPLTILFVLEQLAGYTT